MKCQYCGSENIKTGILFTGYGGGNKAGLLYKSGIFGHTEQVYCDLCLDCGSVVRMYIIGDSDKKWEVSLNIPSPQKTES